MTDPYGGYYRNESQPGPPAPKRPWWVMPLALAMLACVLGTVISAMSSHG
jgi:hypothetical protein